jgi:hypothetical protein
VGVGSGDEHAAAVDSCTGESRVVAGEISHGPKTSLETSESKTWRYFTTLSNRSPGPGNPPISRAVWGWVQAFQWHGSSGRPIGDPVM